MDPERRQVEREMEEFQEKLDAIMLLEPQESGYKRYLYREKYGMIGTPLPGKKPWPPL